MTQQTQSDILSFFPTQLKPRKTQEVVLREIDKVYRTGVRIILLEAPVGSGKSAIAMTLARQTGDLGRLPDTPYGAHLLTPRKSLQDQYYADFSSDMNLMKGRNSYPCIIDTKPAVWKPILAAVREGKVRAPYPGEQSCSNAPCLGSPAIYEYCTEVRPCPYKLAIATAQSSPIITHNLHSFIYQTNFTEQFQKRKLLVIDEAHEVEGVIRDFVTKKIIVYAAIAPADVAGLTTIAQLQAVLLRPEYVPEESEIDIRRKEEAADEGKAFTSARDDYLAQVNGLGLNEETLNKGYSLELTPHFNKKNGVEVQTETVIEIIPHHLGGNVEKLLLQYGERVLLMSGTIYNKDVFCRGLGINPAEVHFIRVGSSFPKENRPIYLKSKFQVDTSHANWDNNFEEMMEKIDSILTIFSDAKGLIHAPSYAAADRIVSRSRNSRLVTHQPNTFLTTLEHFFEEKEKPLVLVSPVCQQGVDFKGDRGRFQIILRVPYLNTSSKFASDKVKNDFPWYNHQALVTFGQQLGRVNRSEDDFGATFLIDERFNKFVTRNNSVLPGWVKEAIQR